MIFLLLFLHGLSSPSYDAREASQRCLVATYPLSAPAMLIGLKSRDAETAHRCSLLCTRYIVRDYYRIMALWVLLGPEEFTYADADKVAHYSGEYQYRLVMSLYHITGETPLYDYPTNKYTFNTELHLYRWYWRNRRRSDAKF